MKVYMDVPYSDELRRQKAKLQNCPKKQWFTCDRRWILGPPSPKA